MLAVLQAVAEAMEGLGQELAAGEGEGGSAEAWQASHRGRSAR
jgi:hypothetical protein